MSRAPLFITFCIDSVLRYPHEDEDRISLNEIRYGTSGLAVRRLLAIYEDYREHLADARRRYGTDHYRGSAVIMEIRRGEEFAQDVDITSALPILHAQIDAISTNPELSAIEKSALMPRINDGVDLIVWRDRYFSRKPKNVNADSRSAA
jgi:hypothetical protein